MVNRDTGSWNSLWHQGGLLALANKNTGCRLNSNFRKPTDSILVEAHPKCFIVLQLFVVYLKFQFNYVSCILLATVFEEVSIVPTNVLTILAFFLSGVSYYAKYFRLPLKYEHPHRGTERYHVHLAPSRVVC